jgi:peptidoglycan/LPS O-acetylase OafA/YrhL
MPSIPTRGNSKSLPAGDASWRSPQTAAVGPLDLGDTGALKALGILAIVLHNFYHKLPNTPRENEFDFNPQRFQDFIQSVVDPRQSFQALFSSFGHFGVELFIFLSAYGLASKYWEISSWSGFVWARIKKLYPMFLLALGLWLLLKVGETRGNFPQFLLRTGDDLLLTTLAVINLVPGYDLPPVGPWWFLPFIVQFYCLWQALAAFSRRFGVRGLLALSIAALLITMAFQARLNQTWAINLLETPLGHMPEICLGIACARFGVRVGPASALAAAVIFVLGNVWAILWPLTFICALVMLLYLYRLTAGLFRGRRIIESIALISMPLFFVNGFLRGPFLSLVAHYNNRWYVALLTGLVFAVFSMGVAYALLIAEGRLQSLSGGRGLRRGQSEPASPS